MVSGSAAKCIHRGDPKAHEKKVLPPGLAITTAATAAAVAAAAAAITAVTTTATATTTKTATSTAATAATILAGFGFINGEAASIDFFAIKLGNSGRAFLLARHFDEAKATWASRVAVFHDARWFDGASLSKKLLQILAGGRKREISYVKFHCHVDVPFPRGEQREAANRIGFGLTVGSEGPASDAQTSGFWSWNQPALELSKNASANGLRAGRITVDAREKD
jgi:hypothetical protein